MPIRYRRGHCAVLASVLVVLAMAGAGRWVVIERRVATGPDQIVLAELDALADAFPEPGEQPLEWPRDHALKSDQFAESWQFAGLLRARDGSRHGFQLAFYRIALQPDTTERSSAWAVQHVLRAQLSIELENAPARSGVHTSRAALGLAGVQDSPARGWVGDWSFEHDPQTGGFRLSAAISGAGLELQLRPGGRAAVAVSGPAHRGYWWPGLTVTGTLDRDGEKIPVDGRAMLDRVWGRALPAGRGQLSLTRLWLEDEVAGVAIRCEQLRRRGGGGSPLTACLVHPAGIVEPGLSPVAEGWREAGGARFPLRWEINLGQEERAWAVAPMGTTGAVRQPGAWSGVVSVAGLEHSWGLLELSNFPAP